MEKITQTAGRDILGDFAPLFAHLNDDVLFGEVWNENAIDVKTKCIVTVVALIASGITDTSLSYHLQNANIHHAASGGGQLLICVGGRGWYQEAGKQAVPMTPGTVITIPANVKHWHGAASDSWFSHLAISIPGEGVSSEWREPVSDAEYGTLAE